MFELPPPIGSCSWLNSGIYWGGWNPTVFKMLQNVLLHVRYHGVLIEVLRPNCGPKFTKSGPWALTSSFSPCRLKSPCKIYEVLSFESTIRNADHRRFSEPPQHHQEVPEILGWSIIIVNLRILPPNPPKNRTLFPGIGTNMKTSETNPTQICAIKNWSTWCKWQKDRKAKAWLTKVAVWTLRDGV